MLTDSKWGVFLNFFADLDLGARIDALELHDPKQLSLKVLGDFDVREGARCLSCERRDRYQCDNFLCHAVGGKISLKNQGWGIPKLYLQPPEIFADLEGRFVCMYYLIMLYTFLIPLWALTKNIARRYVAQPLLRLRT